MTIAPMTERISMILMYSNKVFESEVVESPSLGVFVSKSQEPSSTVASEL